MQNFLPAHNIAVAGSKGNVLSQVPPSAPQSERGTLFLSVISPFHSLFSEIHHSVIHWTLIYFSAKDEKQANKKNMLREVCDGMKKS